MWLWNEKLGFPAPSAEWAVVGTTRRVVEFRCDLNQSLKADMLIKV